MCSSPVISAVIPVHNEAGFIEGALPRLVEALKSVGEPFEIIVAENGSTDATAEIAEGFAAVDNRISVVQMPDPDYGAAMRSGFLAARGTWVVNFDIDFFSSDFLRSGLRLEASADIVLASKRVVGSDDQRSLLRRLGTWGFNLVLRLAFRSRVTDTHGMKMIRRSVVAALTPRIRSIKDLFDTELVIRAEQTGYRIVEIPVKVKEMREARSSFVSRIPRTLKGLWRIRRALKNEARQHSAE